ncbi:hypothetical protein VN97_g7897 [Penicillium thymicola]|uniref:Uncharacterized protein n=1 Tax=Penicillium thymicola TaxID=293382 RepID=A0AAI9X6D7_PENTH|nr:hypothetical protein VN97_g7897 [Penicillium thymicola]
MGSNGPRFLSLSVTLNSFTNLTLHHALRHPPRRPLLTGYEPLDALFNHPPHRHPPSAPPSTPSSPSSPSTSTSPARPPPQTPTNGVTSIKTNNLTIP